ncbi:hypothetical protein L2E82_21952 [Cichorium intybus]|uniref:Uncharacterized protein n=1 Tax=Cichorium intybus TaxID=13427 RepID=A0ACB9DWA1_CICIN|nr:hypothetical protein L2E82_21952 [Cichorium intybus]
MPHVACMLLLSLSSGSDHPDVAATYINVAMMYQDIGKMNKALRYLQEALKKNERPLGEEHIQTAVCYHALAIEFNCVGACKLSHQHEKKTYDILVKQLGEDDSRTRESQNWMKTFKVREAQMAAQKQKGQPADAVSAQAAIDMSYVNHWRPLLVNEMVGRADGRWKFQGSKDTEEHYWLGAVHVKDVAEPQVLFSSRLLLLYT